uniref:Uncharacterized protein n=1 Tax=Solanum lycopersicum TaxID=4081 RepID=A0A3Q7IZ19_SOLLC
MDICQKKAPMANTSFILLANFDTSDLLVSCVSSSGQTAYPLLMCWSPPPYTLPTFVERLGLWCSLDSSWKTFLVIPQHSCRGGNTQRIVPVLAPER